MSIFKLRTQFECDAYTIYTVYRSQKIKKIYIKHINREESFIFRVTIICLKNCHDFLIFAPIGVDKYIVLGAFII